MPSIKGRIFYFMVKHRHWFQFRLRRPSIDGIESIMQLRRDIEKHRERLSRIPEGMEIEPVSINGLEAEWVFFPEVNRDKVILYFHGGAYVLGSCRLHRWVVSKFVRNSGINALQVGYRLAPENPFPAAFDDAMAAYGWLLDSGVRPENIVLAGDSAGGGLCLAALLAIRDRNLPRPAAAVVLSPWTDLKCSGESYRTRAKADPTFWGGTIGIVADSYGGGHDLELTYISPLYGDLDGLPPLLMFVGENEVHLDDATRFAVKVKEAGGRATLRIGKGMFHCYPALAPSFPEASQAMEEICGFINYHIGGDNGLPEDINARAGRTTA